MKKVIELFEVIDYVNSPDFVTIEEMADELEGRGGARPARKGNLSELEGSVFYEDDHFEE